MGTLKTPVSVALHFGAPIFLFGRNNFVEQRRVSPPFSDRLYGIEHFDSRILQQLSISPSHIRSWTSVQITFFWSPLYHQLSSRDLPSTLPPKMIGGLFIYNHKGEVLISRVYRDDIGFVLFFLSNQH